MTIDAENGMQAQGFILQATYRIQSGTPVVHLYGKLDNGQTFLVRDTRQRPHFYIAAADAKRAATLGVSSFPAGKQTFAGAPAHRVDVPVPGDAPGVREKLHAADIETLEADVRFAVRYLIDRGIRGSLTISGPALRGDGVTWVFENPELSPADANVRLKLLSFDIETDPQAEQLLAIALFGHDVDEVLIVEPDGRKMPENATGFADERGVIDAFCQRVCTLDPDVLTGWNVVDFDLTVLARIAKRVRHPFEFGRDIGAVRIRPAQGYFGKSGGVLGHLSAVRLDD